MRNILSLPARVMVVVTLTACGVFAAAAQTAQPTPPMDSVPEKTAPGPVSTDQPKTLSDKLDQTNGVIKPNEVDPAIEKPAPHTNTGDVIAPPGTPDGAPAPQPK